MSSAVARGDAEARARDDAASDDVDGEAISDIGIGDDILVVDDNPANLVAIEAALAPLGRNLVSVRSGVAALAKLLEQDFALILLDVAMPGITGIETARLIRSRERTRGTPILFVTGMSWEDAAIDEAYAAGGFDFLTKPVRAEVLRAKARVFLKLQERTRALRRQAEQLRASQAQLYEHQLHEQRSKFESELLETKLQQLAQGERRQHELAGIIGNELLNPLQTLQMAFDLLREHPKAGTGERIHSMVEHRLIHVTRLVKMLIDVAQVAAGQLQLRPATVDFIEIVRRAIDDCRAVIETHGVQVRLDAEGEAPPLVVGDPARLLQAITTLIDHAARSTGQGGEVAITVRATSGEVVIRLVDTGRGIAPDRMPRLFEVCGENPPAPAGTSALNLGFTLVKRLIELHDGSVRAWSEGLGKGTTFEVRLSLAPQDVELPDLAAQDPEGSCPDPLTEPTMRMQALDANGDPAGLSSEDLVARTYPGDAIAR
ncbi:MAG TPA: response regulator [Kofleriaceae bacterium]|nr:response regulator [Kofleriaceae bacterium]